MLNCIALTLCVAFVASPAEAQRLRLPELHRQFVAACTPADSNGNRSFAPDTASTLFRFAKANRRMIEYFFINNEALKSQYLWAHKDDSSRFAGNVKDTTWDDLFFEALAPMIDNYFLATTGKHVDGIAYHQTETISSEKLKHFSVRFFYPFLFQGGIAMHICVGANGFQGMEPPRDFTIEAFCFSAIIGHTQIEDDPLMNDVGSALNGLNGLSLDGTESALRDQLKEHVWKDMLKSDALSAVLQKQYDEMKGWLTFRVE